MKKFKLFNWFKKNVYGIVVEIGKVNRIGFRGGEEWYMDRVLYKFGKPINQRRYWNRDEFRKEKEINKNKRIVVKGFHKDAV